jgi:hypothetical protein
VRRPFVCLLYRTRPNRARRSSIPAIAGELRRKRVNAILMPVPGAQLVGADPAQC